MRRGAVRLLLFDESWMGPGYRAIVGYKGFGAVGLIALLHLVESLGMERVGVVATSGGPEYAFRDERGIAYPFEVYVERERRLLALVSRELPARPVRAEYVWRITRLARRAGAEVLLAVGGLDSRYKQSPSDQARWVANRHYRGPLPPDPELERGLMVVGPLALQLMFSEALAIPTLAILPYARADAPDPAAAAVAVLRLNSLLGLDVAVEPLLAEAARIQAELSRLEEELGRAGRGEERPYI